jgi:prepilin-type N-terminal cleavage/methylation domain-containing protein
MNSGRIPSRQTGVSLFELMIALAVIGLLAGVAVPTYRSFIETANMTKVSSNFDQAIRVARNTFQMNETRFAIGLTAATPDNTDDWIKLLNANGAKSPGGDDAYISATNKKNPKKGPGRGDAESGSIGVEWNDGKSQLRIWRPLYLSLTEQRATITADGVDIKDQRQE